MNAQQLLLNYGFQHTDGVWSIWRDHACVAELEKNSSADPATIKDEVHFTQSPDGTWAYVNSKGQPGSLRFETNDARDVIAFTQSILASSVFHASGLPVDEGFEFRGTHYSSPLMFDDYADFVVEKRDDGAWVQMPEGEYKAAYLTWRNEFAERVMEAKAAAPGEVKVELKFLTA